MSTERSAFRKHVLKPDGGSHQIFGGGVPIIRMCFKTYKDEVIVKSFAL